jgi:BCD family chlorophyll transporter-like MFS transporter
MAVELMLPALVPGLLVGLHHAVQMTRPRMGFGSDMGGRRTPWIAGGMAVLALGGFLAAVATAWMSSDRLAGLCLAVLGYALVGLGVSAAGTSLLVLLAKQVAQERRAAAATLVWVLMIIGFAVTAGLAGRWLDPYSPARLVAVSGTVSVVALCVAWAALWGVEQDGVASRAAPAAGAKPSFRTALAQVWTEPDARQFTIFVFVSMVAYSAQDLILEPFAGSGTTGIAALAEGFSCRMIDIEADHVADIERKLAYLRGEGALTFQEHNHAKALRTKETPLGGLFGEAV